MTSPDWYKTGHKGDSSKPKNLKLRSASRYENGLIDYQILQNQLRGVIRTRNLPITDRWLYLWAIRW